MCGIVAYLGEKIAAKEIVDGLKQLEYRGYDSWGIAACSGKKLKITKKVGKISGVTNYDFLGNGNLGIGHTRWATHGKVNAENAHPQIDCKGKIAVVHNGIIENYQELKSELVSKGHKFKSQTDTEVIPHLLEEFLKKYKLEEALRQAFLRLNGSFAFCLITRDLKKIYAVNNGCPLVLGVGEGETYISSDVAGFNGKIKKAIFLKKGQMAVVGEKVKIVDIKSGNLKANNAVKINTTDDKSKDVGNFEHYLLKEIFEQPSILRKIAQYDKQEIETNAALIRNSNGTFFVACGTAFHAGLVGTYSFASNAKMHINNISAGEFPNFESFINDGTLMVPISQSGETADVLEAVRTAKKKKAKILAIVNNEYSTLVRAADISIITPAGPEISVLSTKAFSAQVATLFLLSKAIVGKTSQARKTLLNLADFMESFLSNVGPIKNLAKKIKNVEHLFTLGRSINYPTALEAALKIKEVSYIHAEGFAGADLKHGPIALIEKDTPVIVFVANDMVKEEMLSNAAEVKARGGYIIGVSGENNEIFDLWIKVVDIAEISPIINILPMQLLAYFLAVEKGLDPDKPRNLAKSVTVK